MSLKHVQLMHLPKILDERGNLSFFQNDDHIPFEIKRVCWLYDVPGGEMRGGHAFKDQQEVIIALSGSFDVVLNDGQEEKVFTLNRSYFALYVPRMVWRHIENFSTNSLAFIASDNEYNENAYIRNFEEFRKRAFKEQLLYSI
ncbi:MAG: sugar 3,4-ketoisomerase [Ilyomonas sp.]